MYLFLHAPILSLFIFSIVPFIFGYLFYINTPAGEDNLQPTLNGVAIGLLIDIPIFCFVFWVFSTI